MSIYLPVILAIIDVHLPDYCVSDYSVHLPSCYVSSYWCTFIFLLSKRLLVFINLSVMLAVTDLHLFSCYETDYYCTFSFLLCKQLLMYIYLPVMYVITDVHLPSYCVGHY